MRSIDEVHEWRGIVLLGVGLLAGAALPLAGQEPDRMWAAQTGPSQVTLAWDSIPGAYEYRIFAGAPETITGNLRTRPYLGWLSGSARSAIVSGKQVLSDDITLVGMDRSGRVVRKKRFNRVQRAMTAARIQPPDEVTAEATSATEVTVSWTPVQGATAYVIGRAVGGEGLRMLCALCSTEPKYVDRDAAPGESHTYTIAALFPNGISEQIRSNDVTPGETQLATAAGSVTSPAPTTPATGISKSIEQPVDGQTDGNGLPAGTYTNAGGTGTTACPQPATSSPVRLPVGTSGTTTKSISQPVDGQTDGSSLPAGTSSTTGGGAATGCPTTTTGQVHTATPVTTPTGGTHTATPIDTTTTQNPPTLIETVNDWLTGGTSTAAAPAGVAAVVAGPGAVRVTWSASTTGGVTGYRVIRRVNGGFPEKLNDVSASTRSYTDAFFPTTLFAAGPVRVTYSVIGLVGTATGAAGASGEVVVQPPASATATPATGTTASCKLDYQRADNMWAAFGRPDGFLGVESLTLAAGGDKVFVSDWKYEKIKNDGTNYYGSHLRVATNAGPRALRIQVRTTSMFGLQTNTWTRMDPGKSQQFQADLLEMYCEP